MISGTTGERNKKIKMMGEREGRGRREEEVNGRVRWRGSRGIITYRSAEYQFHTYRNRGQEKDCVSSRKRKWQLAQSGLEVHSGRVP